MLLVHGAITSLHLRTDTGDFRISWTTIEVNYTPSERRFLIFRVLMQGGCVQCRVSVPVAAEVRGVNR